MKLLNRSVLLALAIMALLGCKKDKEEVTGPNSPGSGGVSLHLVGSATTENLTVELYADSGTLQVGHNTLYAKVRNASGPLIAPTNLSWQPQMTMVMDGMEHTHGCPYGQAVPTNDATQFEGYAVFIMASGDMDHWAMLVNFTFNGTVHQVAVPLTVVDGTNDHHKVYATTMGSDGNMYMLALLRPTSPSIGVNAMVAGLWKHVDDHDFPQVDGYTIRVDPRMPGMGNHGAPGNVDLVQGTDGFYHGQVGFSMSGYWKINLMVESSEGEVVAGNTVTDQVLESSIYFKLQF